MQKSRFTGLGPALLFSGCVSVGTQEPDQLSAHNLAASHPRSAVVTPHAHLNGQAHDQFVIPNIDSLVNFNDHYSADGVDSTANPVRECGTTTGCV